jgi:hypothetical protein
MQQATLICHALIVQTHSRVKQHRFQVALPLKLVAADVFGLLKKSCIKNGSPQINYHVLQPCDYVSFLMTHLL